jgi:hypothetical protein
VGIEEEREVPDAEGRREEQQHPQAHHVDGRAEGEHRGRLQRAGPRRAPARRAPHARAHAAHDPEEQAAAEQPQVGFVATRPELADLRAAPEHARLAEVEVQQRAIEIAAQTGHHAGAAVLLRAQRAHPAVGDDRDEKHRDSGEDQPADGEAEQAPTLGAAA